MSIEKVLMDLKSKVGVSLKPSEKEDLGSPFKVSERIKKVEKFNNTDSVIDSTIKEEKSESLELIQDSYEKIENDLKLYISNYNANEATKGPMFTEYNSYNIAIFRLTMEVLEFLFNNVERNEHFIKTRLLTKSFEDKLISFMSENNIIIDLEPTHEMLFSAITTASQILHHGPTKFFNDICKSGTMFYNKQIRGFIDYASFRESVLTVTNSAKNDIGVLAETTKQLGTALREAQQLSVEAAKTILEILEELYKLDPNNEILKGFPEFMSSKESI